MAAFAGDDPAVDRHPITRPHDDLVTRRNLVERDFDFDFGAVAARRGRR